MSSPDPVGEAAEHGVTMTVTAAAIGVSSWAERHRKRIAEGRPRPVLDFRSPSEFGERDPLPKGLVGVIGAEEWKGMSDKQRQQVDPDRVGRWPTDYTMDYRGETATPGAKLQSTLDQSERVAVLGQAAGVITPVVSEMSRGRAAALLREMEEALGPVDTRKAYLDAGMVYREVEMDKDGNPHYKLEFPDSQVVQGPAPAPAASQSKPAGQPLPTPKMSVTNQTVLTDPSTWKSKSEPVTPAQAGMLRDYGFSSEDISKIRKGGASTVITAIESFGDTDPTRVDKAFEKAVAATIQTPPSQPPPAAPTPQQGPTR